MNPNAVHRARSIFWRVCRLTSLILAGSFLLVASGQNSSSPVQRYSATDRTRQSRHSNGPRLQVPTEIAHPPVSPNFQKRRVVQGHQVSETTPIQIFYDPHPTEYPTGSQPASLVLADFNGDWKVDSATANYGSNSVSVLLGNGDGTFQTRVDYSTGGGPRSVVVGDFNDDGKVDLAIANCSDASVSVLLGNGDGSFQTHVDFPTGPLPVSLAVGDFNGDGKLDLTVARSYLWGMVDGAVSVLLGNGDGTFQTHVDYHSEGAPGAVAVADFNLDGKPDIVVTSGQLYHCAFNYEPTCKGSIDLLLGNGDGTFQPYLEYKIWDGYPEDGFSTIAVDDFNGDGKPDLAVGWDDGSLSVMLGNGDGTFQARVDYQTTGHSFVVAVADFNGDGKPDLAVTGSSLAVSILLGNGDGTFQTNVDYPVGSSPASVVIGDLNGDGKPDLAIANSSGNSVSVLLGNGDGTFPAPRHYYATAINPQALAVADFNHDGKPDLAVVDGYDSSVGVFDSSVSILLGNGDGTFQKHVDYPVGFYGNSVAVGDFDGDGKLDLAVTNYYDYSVSVLLGNGDGAFQPHVDYPAARFPSSVAVGDFNGDGKTDLAVPGSNWPYSPYGVASVLLGNGDGTFQRPVDYGASNNTNSLAAADFNGDGKVDLVVAIPEFCLGTPCAPGAISVLLGNGDGTFQPGMEYAMAHNPQWVSVEDLNGDGKQDVVMANAGEFGESGSLSVLLGNGDATFQPEVVYLCCDWSLYTPSRVAITDFDGDGKEDLAITDEVMNQVTVLLGKGDGTFTANTNYALGQGHLAPTPRDFNNDGAADLAFITPGNAVSILLNMRGTLMDLQTSANPSVMGQPVTFTATIHSSLTAVTAIPTGSVAFMAGSEQLGSQILDGSGAASVAVGALSGGEHDIVAVYNGDSNFNPNKSAILSQKVPGFGVSAAPGTATLKAGTSVDFTLTSTAVYGFGGPVSLSCSVSPTPPLAPVCALNPQSLTLAQNGSATAKLTITTTGTTASLDRTLGRSRPFSAVWFSVFGLALLGAGHRRFQTKRTLVAVLLLLICASASLQVACGGSASTITPPPPPPPHTPAGQYTVTVNAASGSIVHSTSVTITVQ